MKVFAIVICWMVPLFVFGQQAVQVNFSKAENVSDLLKDAQNNGKMIFIDAFTTWCGPCKKMDKEVFVDSRVAAYMNQNFVCIRVQMDSTKNDTERLARWRNEAKRWSHYVTGYPCFLFLQSNGDYAGRALGFHPANEFLKLLKNATDSNMNYQAQISRFREDKLNREELLNLAFRAKENKDSIAKVVALEYKKRFIDPVPFNSHLNPEFARFLGEFYYEAFNLSDSIIQYMYTNPLRTDSLFNQSEYSKPIVEHLINRDYVAKYLPIGNLNPDSQPDWILMQRRIADAYDKDLAQKIVIAERARWAFNRKQFTEFARLEFERIERYGMDTTEIGIAFLNNMIYEIIFKIVIDKKVLRQATNFMREIVEIEAVRNKRSTSHLDTYATILYKSGRRNKAQAVEKLALDIANERKDEARANNYAKMLERMKNGEEIWKVN